jgi:hypothetical protein
LQAVKKIVRFGDRPHSGIVATFSEEDGKITLWDASIELRQMMQFVAWEDTSSTPESQQVLRDVLLLPCSAAPVTLPPSSVSISLMSVAHTYDLCCVAQGEKKDEKWSDWCTTDINVEVRAKALYPGRTLPYCCAWKSSPNRFFLLQVPKE